MVTMSLLKFLSPLCPVSSFKMYLDLLHPDNSAFFQYPNKKKSGFTREVVGKNALGYMMKELSEKAKLSKNYTNHQIQKTTATGMKESGFSLQQISNVTKHKNLDSLRHYVSGPTLKEKESYNEGLFNYGQKDCNTAPPKRKSNDNQDQPHAKIGQNQQQDKENLPQESSNQIEIRRENQDGNPNSIKMHNVVTTNQLRQTANMFQNASFSNCNFNFTLPQ